MKMKSIVIVLFGLLIAASRQDWVNNFNWVMTDPYGYVNCTNTGLSTISSSITDVCTQTSPDFYGKIVCNYEKNTIEFLDYLEPTCTTVAGIYQPQMNQCSHYEGALLNCSKSPIFVKEPGIPVVLQLVYSSNCSDDNNLIQANSFYTGQCISGGFDTGYFYTNYSCNATTIIEEVYFYEVSTSGSMSFSGLLDNKVQGTTSGSGNSWGSSTPSATGASSSSSSGNLNICSQSYYNTTNYIKTGTCINNYKYSCII